MAKTKGPLLSMQAHGTVHKLLTYSKRKENQITRKYRDNQYTPTPKQRASRMLLRQIVAYWQALANEEKESWNLLASHTGYSVTGYQLFCKWAMLNPYKIIKLAAYWPFNEWDGNYINNYVGNWGRLGKATGDYPNYPELKQAMNKKFGLAADLTHPTTYFTTPHSAKLNPENDSAYIEAWVKLGAVTGFRVIWYKQTGSPNNGVQFRVYNGKIYCGIGDGTITASWSSTKLIDDNKWHMVSMLIDRTGYGEIYLDGIQDGIRRDLRFVTGSINPIIQLWIGTSGASLRGWIDELCFYRRALEPDEILRRYKSALKR